MASSSKLDELVKKPGPKSTRAVGPRLRILLYIVFALVALLGANSVYLSAITALGWFNRQSYEDLFYQYMFLLHLGLGLLLIVPLVVFGVLHMLASRHRRNRRAVFIGYALFFISLLLLISGVLLMRVGGLELKQPLARSLTYWLHALSPLVAIWLYWLHRLVGPRIKWRIGASYALAVGGVVLLMLFLKSQDPRHWNVEGPTEGVKYFEPSLVRTVSGNFIPARSLMNDEYCLKCHADAYQGWFHSAHHFSSFNNPAYLASVRETRKVAFQRDGNVKASRWCAGCHDPVPFLSGAFDAPDYDDINDPTAHAGITCTVCHAITNFNSTRGNADYTIEEPLHYPFAYSDHELLQFVNNLLVKAKPDFHKKTFLKPFHKTAEFCSVCHKVHLPKALTKYKEFLRGQNHYDNYLFSGVSGHGARSFYYPPKAKHNCNECHMPLQPSTDFGAKRFAGAEVPSIHDHLFPAANTAVAWFNKADQIIKAHQEFLEDVLRVDIFGIKEDGTVDGRLHAPLRPEVPTLKPGETYLLETVIRTLTMGHLFTQGTVDSNEVWMDVVVRSDDRVLGRSGAMDDSNQVDRWAHYVNAFVLDKNGNRIARRNPQDIFVPLYNHQIPPGAAQVVHYSLQVPEDVTSPITVEVALKYRKFDKEYMDFVANSLKPEDKPLRGHNPGQPYRNELPVTVLASDSITFPVAGGETHDVRNETPSIPAWERWNDYGIGLLLKGTAELRQASSAFREAEKLGVYHGPLNLARAYYREGRLDDAVDAINRAVKHSDPPAPPWTVAWLSGLINREQGHLDEAERNFRKVLEDRTPEMIERGFDFSLDIEVINLLGLTLFDQANLYFSPDQETERDELLRKAVEQFERTLEIDSEDVTAHYNLQLLYGQLSDQERAAYHRELHTRYKPDPNARDRAFQLAREKYPWANHAAESLVIYSLHRPGAPGLPAEAQVENASEDSGE